MIKIAIDSSPLKNESKFRGVGMYTKKLIQFLKKEKEIELVEFNNRQIPKGVDLIHYPYFFPFAFFLPLLPPEKFVVTVHDLIPLVFPQAYPPGYKGKLKYLIQKELLKRASTIIADSQCSADDVVRFIGYPREKIKVVYLAAANQVEKILDRKVLQTIKTKFSLPERFVLYVGDVNYNKNLPGLIKACRLAKISLVIVGKQALIQNFAANHIENRSLVELNELAKERNDIVRTGFVDENELAALYSLASVYCQPSFYEGFGLQILEAMACGCPVVTGNISSMPEIAGEAAIFVDPNDVNDIANGINMFLNNEKVRNEKIKIGFKQAEKYSWQKTADETVNVYRSIC